MKGEGEITYCPAMWAEGAERLQGKKHTNNTGLNENHTLEELIRHAELTEKYTKT